MSGVSVFHYLASFHPLDSLPSRRLPPCPRSQPLEVFWTIGRLLGSSLVIVVGRSRCWHVVRGLDVPRPSTHSRWAFPGDMPLLVAVVTDYRAAVPGPSSPASVSRDGLLLHQGHEVLDVLAETGKATCLRVAIRAAWHRLRWGRGLGLRLMSKSSNPVVSLCIVIFIIVINIEPVMILAADHSGCLLTLSLSH